MQEVLSWGLTPFSGSLRLDKGPTERVVKLGIAAAKMRVSHIHIATFRDSASLGAEVSIARIWMKTF